MIQYTKVYQLHREIVFATYGKICWWNNLSELGSLWKLSSISSYKRCLSKYKCDRLTLDDLKMHGIDNCPIKGSKRDMLIGKF